MNNLIILILMLLCSVQFIVYFLSSVNPQMLFHFGASVALHSEYSALYGHSSVLASLPHCTSFISLFSRCGLSEDVFGRQHNFHTSFHRTEVILTTQIMTVTVRSYRHVYFSFTFEHTLGVKQSSLFFSE